MKISPEKQTVEKALEEIKALAERMEAGDTDRLSSDLWDLESKASALRSFLLNKVLRTAQTLTYLHF
jgi:hypothetical protein